MRHAKHDAQQRVSLIRRTSATAVSSTTESLSAPVTLEPAPTAIPSAPPTSEPWRHPDELAFINIRGETWDDMTIIRFLRANILSIPPRPTSTVEPWVLIGCADGTEVTLPRMYRVPLLWVLKFLWMSVALVLRENEWEDRKFDLLHIARLVATLIAGARTAIDNGTIERGWRCAAFDRALRRYWHRWLLTRDEFVRAFWYEFNEEEYEGDVLKLGWGQWVLKGHKGFLLTKEEVAQGISAAEFMHGFVVDEERGTFKWVDNSLESPSKMDAQLSVPVERKRLVPVEEQTPIPEPAIQTKLLPPPPPPSEPQTQTTPKRKFSAPISTPPPPKKVSFSHVEVPALKRRKTGNAPVCGSVTLAELVSRIPIAGRHRSYGSGTPLETSASRIRRAWQVEEFHMPVDLTPQNTETTPTTHKSPKPTASPVDVEHKAVDTIPVRLEPDERRCSPVETTVSLPVPSSLRLRSPFSM
ncbi:hypothetical protein B0H19DRAFT_440153 [Mycena capillaripes]|nr:hypothetical protein B0H19DRAFT_440153 [Mycena capillaripes]